MKQINTLIVSLFIVLFIGISLAVADSYNPEVYQAQKALKKSGYNPGQTDGLWGKATKRAIERFQRDVGLPVTGRLDEQTKARLGLRPFAVTRGIRVIAKTGQSLYLYKNYYALVVGVSNYEKWPRLPNAVNDAKEVASKLKELGFEVKLVLDPSSREMKTALSEMVYDMGIEENRAILFYYAGHGETETLADKTKMGYIIPRDCPILEKDPKGFATHAISMRDIESVSMRIKSKHVLMLFDSCFSGSLFSLVRAVPDDITEKSALPVRQYITAGREDEQVPDKSMFKRCLLLGLEGDADLTGDGYITGSELGMYLSDKVVNYTHRRQHPQYGKINNPDLDRGDFIFALKAPSQPSTQIPAAPSPSLEAEKQRLAEERERIKRERQELEELKALMEERKKLEAQRKRFEAEKKKMGIENWINRINYVVVSINSHNGKLLGTGIIVSEDGYIITNDHVVRNQEDIKVRSKNATEHNAKIIGRDPKTDLALIKIKVDKRIPSARVEDSDRLRVGEKVVAIGNPFSPGDSVKVGTVIGINKKHEDFDVNYIQTDLSINPEDSGGPLFDLDGEVVGINTAIFTQTGKKVDIGFAIPINTAKAVMSQLVKHGRVIRGYIGITMQSVTPSIKEAFGLRTTEGALISEVVKGSPAEKVGLERGDVIVSFDGRRVKNVASLPYLISTRVGKKVEIIAIRRGKEKKFTLKVEEHYL